MVTAAVCGLALVPLGLALGSTQAEPAKVGSDQVTVMTPAYVCAFDLSLALRAASPELTARNAEVARREGELRLAELGVSTVLTVTTGVAVGQNLLRDQAARWDTSLQMDAGLGYRYDEVAIVRARNALTTASKRADDQQRADVLSALISLSRLRAAERLSAQTDAAAVEAESLAASVRQSAAAAQTAWAETDVTPGQEANPESTPEADQAANQAPDLAPDLALNIRELDLAAARARATAYGRAEEANAARAELARLGIEPPGPYVLGSPLTHTGPAACLVPAEAPVDRTGGPDLPRPGPHTTTERRLLEHAADLAAALHRRATFGPLRDFSMTAHYQEGGARVLAELELDGGRPAAGVNLRLREAAAHNWGVGVAATIRLDDSMGAALTSATEQLESAQAALAAFDASLNARVLTEVATVETAWLQLAFAAEAVSIAEGRLALATEERDRTRAEQVLSRAIDALEREYQAYLRAVGRYLAEFDLPWSSLSALE